MGGSKQIKIATGPPQPAVRVTSPLTDKLNQKPNLVLTTLPTILAGSAISLNAATYVAALLTILVLWIRPSPTERIRLNWTCAILPALALAIFLRPNYPSTAINVIFFILGCILVVRAVQLSSSIENAVVSLIDGIGLFLVTSVALWLAGFRGPQERSVGLENSLTGGERVIFPLSNSLAATPAVAAVFTAAIVPVLITYRKYRAPRLLATLCAIGIFALSDSRISLVAALIVSASALLIPRLFRTAAPWLIGGLLLVPFLYTYIQNLVGRLVSAVGIYAPWFVRSGENASTLNGRDYIWAQSLDFYRTRIDWVHQMFGFGSFGHAESGASATYNANFGGFGRDDRLLTPHNSMLQLLLDGGWIVAAVAAITLIYMAWLLSRRNSPAMLSGLAMLVTLSIVGVTEVALSPGHAQPTWWVLLTLSTIALSQPSLARSETRLQAHRGGLVDPYTRSLPSKGQRMNSQAAAHQS